MAVSSGAVPYSSATSARLMPVRCFSESARNPTSSTRSGDPAAIGGYLGSSDAFDEAITEFADRYADQNESDYQAFADAIDRGDLEADLHG